MRLKVPGGRLTLSRRARSASAGRGLWRRSRRQPRLRQPLTPTSLTRQTYSSSLDTYRKTCPGSGNGFADVGLTTVQACGDSARNVLVLPGGRASTPTRPSTPTRWLSTSPPSSPGTATTQTCPQIQDQRVGLPGGLRSGRDQRHRSVAERVPPTGPSVQRSGRRWTVRRRTHGSDIDVFIEPGQAVELTRAIAQLFGELGKPREPGSRP